MSDLIEVITQDILVVEEQVPSSLDIADDELVSISEEVIYIVSESAQGPQGPQGAQGLQGPQGEVGQSGAQNVSIGAENPLFGSGATGLWVQTGLGVSGHDLTFWIEDGQ